MHNWLQSLTIPSGVHRSVLYSTGFNSLADYGGIPDRFSVRVGIDSMTESPPDIVTYTINDDGLMVSYVNDPFADD
jgi:hypothetical protein